MVLSVWLCRLMYGASSAPRVRCLRRLGCAVVRALPYASERFASPVANVKVSCQQISNALAHFLPAAAHIQMNRIVECVPNFSEGRRPDVIKRLCETIESVETAVLLGIHRDADHNRSVI